MIDKENNNNRISVVLSTVKVLVWIFKHVDWKRLLPSEKSLTQEVDMRFGTTHNVAELFVKSFEYVREIINGKNQPSAIQSIQILLFEDHSSGG